ncbi:MerR family transcriptional regulator [Breznakia pachnodae]|uniref:DNA-binding transcriptional MerR regulator n=1 Tax=Breznakia pachnodae TaxID=265178 RepID=A0ABU0E0J7_9FIRM|nr:MerR family transcriptional regulator [Breznakia pachnodae]MDQ0360412.1 DNA-binding transcriptional MerR regulator [Breznakia pachnodae]
MYTMKETCEKVNMSYETLKFYCNEGLVPNVKRNKNNYRIFSDKDIAWISSLTCLKDCGMSIQEMKEYLDLCLEGEGTIPKRKEILDIKRKALENKLKDIQDNIDYIDNKQKFYDDVLSGKIEYFSNLME